MKTKPTAQQALNGELERVWGKRTPTRHGYLAHQVYKDNQGDFWEVRYLVEETGCYNGLLDEDVEFTEVFPVEGTLTKYVRKPATY